MRQTSTDCSTGKVHCHDLRPAPADMRADVLQALALPQTRLAPKFFYDANSDRAPLFSVHCLVWRG
mgnify:CR=1 FL=1